MTKINLRLSPNRILWIAGGAATLTALAFLIWWNSGAIEIINSQNTDVVPNSLTGRACDRELKRPLAVMMASDPVARPLSGIAQAELVFEMPVTPDGVTRMMALFQCQQPKEIGSVRSARVEFLPLARDTGAILAHWGGEYDALEALRQKVLDNIDALIHEQTAFFRKRGVKAPHNGFTDPERLYALAQKLGYELGETATPYTRSLQETPKNLSNIADGVAVNYPGLYGVLWTYDPVQGRYLRSRGGQPEKDRNNNATVAADVVVVLETSSQPLRDQYLIIRMTGTGSARIYQKGVVISGMWQRSSDDSASPFKMIDEHGKDIPIKPGILWFEIVPTEFL